MNLRQINKYFDYAYCSHMVYDKEVIIYDPYYEQVEEYCKLGRYGRDGYEEPRCHDCRHFSISRAAMREARNIKHKIKKEYGKSDR